MTASTDTSPVLERVSSGIDGLDDVLNGGLPRGHSTLLCGSAGCGKTLIAMQFLCRGALDEGRPGVFVSFEESADDLAANIASLGFDLPQMQADDLLRIETIRLDPQDIIETGEYDLEGLILRIVGAVREIGATRVVVDTIEVLFGALSNESIIRSEMKRLFLRLKDEGVTALITAESGGEGRISRHGIEEYVSDCVIVLDHRVTEQMSTRRLRVLKFRGSMHAGNEFPFLISSRGVTVAPVTSLGLDYSAPTDRISMGIDRLDAMLSGGVYRASSVLISGSAGSGKSTFATALIDAACRRGERSLMVSHEESINQITRNMASVGFDLKRWVDAGLLTIESIRPTLLGLESHLAWLHDLVERSNPQVVAIDPVTGISRSGTDAQVTGVLLREIDVLKSRGITALFTALTGGLSYERTHLQISSLIDTWIQVGTVPLNGEQNHVLNVIKSRGTAHSNQMCEFTISDRGIELIEPYVGPAGVLTGSGRVIQQLADEADEQAEADDLERAEQALERERTALEREIASRQAEFADEENQLKRRRSDRTRHLAQSARRSSLLGQMRWATDDSGGDEAGDEESP